MQEYPFSATKKIGQDMVTVRAESLNECISQLAEMKKAFEETFGEEERLAVTHVDDEPSALQNCEQPQTHGMKYAKRGANGSYCTECWKSKKQRDGTWKTKR